MKGQGIAKSVSKVPFSIQKWFPSILGLKDFTWAFLIKFIMAKPMVA